MTNPLNNPAVPALPVAPDSYTRPWGAGMLNTLRLYFNQLKALLDNFVLLADSFQQGTFGNTIKLPHVSALNEANLYADGDNTPTLVLWDTLISNFQFTFNPGESATADYDGTYKIDYSLQFANTDNSAHDAVVWLRIDGTDLEGSSTKFTIPARKSAGVPSYVCAYSTVMFDILAGETVELIWGTDKAYNPTGPVDGIYMFYEAAQTTPMPYPSVPSAIGSITFVSAPTA